MAELSELAKILNGGGPSSRSSRQSAINSVKYSNYKNDIPTRLVNYCELPYNDQVGTKTFQEVFTKTVTTYPDGEQTVTNVSNADPTGAEDSKLPGKIIKDMTLSSFISKIHMLYMGKGQDIKWRLGDVTKVLKDPRDFFVPGTTAGVTDENGFVYTKVDFFEDHQITSNFNENYINFYFPPFSDSTPEGIVIKGDMSLQQAINKAEVDKKVTDKKYFGGKGQFYDPKSSLDYRGNFTIRSPGYKSVNDNISYLQFLFEKVSGIVSTYLTEWDLSLYQQESLVTKDNQNFKFIPLTYRMKEDSPLYGMLKGANTDADAYKAFGVLNCAVSKTGSNDPASEWKPEQYPYSASWTTYPDWDVLKSQKKTVWNVDREKVEVPKYYKLVSDCGSFVNSNHPIKTSIMFDDYQGMALAGWEDFSLPYAKAIYTNTEDGISEADARCMNSNTEMISAKKVISENFAENWDVDINAADATNKNKPAQCVDPIDCDDSVPDLGSSKGRRRAKRTKKNKINSATNAVNSARSSQLNAMMSDNLGNNDEDGNVDMGQPKDSANIVGICQRNPSLFGGPHGYNSSPYTVQSYFETNNALLRNTPRIAPCNLVGERGMMWNEGQHYKVESYFNSNGGPSDNLVYRFNGCERYCTQNAARGDPKQHWNRPYEHSYKTGLDYLRDGLFSEGMPATARGERKHRKVYERDWITHYSYDSEGKVSSTYSSWEYPEYDPDTGRTIYYEDGFSSGGSFTNCTLPGEEQHYFTYNGYSKDPCARHSHLDYKRVHWKDGRWKGDWYNTSGRWGYTLEPFNIQYTQYRLHSIPYEKWTLNKVRREIITGWKRVRRYWWDWFGFFEKTVPITEDRWVWELNFPDDHSTARSYYSSGYNLSHSLVEEEVKSKMIDMFGGQKNKPCKLIFCTGTANDEWDDTEFNREGPDAFIMAKTYHAQYFWYYDDAIYHSGRCGRSGWWEYIKRRGIDDFIGVELDDAETIFAGLRDGGFRGNIGGSDLIDNINNATITESTWQGRTNIPSPSNLSHWINTTYYYDIDKNVRSTTSGISGKGILSCIPGILPNKKDTELDYNQYLGTNEPSWDQLQAGATPIRDTPLNNIPLRYYETSAPMAAETWQNNVRYYGPDCAPPVVTAYELPSYIRKAWIRACTNATFYIDEQLVYDKGTKNFPKLTHYWNVPIDTPFRVFYHQALYQRGYLDVIEDMFCSKAACDGKESSTDYALDFKSFEKLLKGDKNGPGVCGNKVYTLSNPNQSAGVTVGDEWLKTTEVVGFNQWIREARTLFENGNARKSQEAFQSAITRRKIQYDAFIDRFKPYENNIAGVYTWNFIQSLERTMIDIFNSVESDQVIEKTMYSYMNILYEYRRFFINKRCNKMDGTLWMIRSLESAIPLILSSLNTNAPSDSVFKDVDEEAQKVAFFTYQNTNSLKLYEIMKGIPKVLDEDRIAKVYVQVKYATEEEYLEDQENIISGKYSEPTIIKVKKWKPKRSRAGRLLFKDDMVLREYTGEEVYVVKPSNGTYRLESKEYLDNLAKIKKNERDYDESILDTIAPDGKTYKYTGTKDYDTAIWDIKWGLKYGADKASEIGDLDIIFGLTEGVDFVKSLEAIEAIPDLTIEDLVCIGRNNVDYWEIPVTCALPRPTGYKTNITLSKLTSDPNEDPDPKPKTEITTTVNTFNNALCPIVENQKYGGLSPQDIIRLHMNHDNMLKNTERI